MRSRMTHLRIITLERHTDSVVRVLRQAACLHVEDILTTEGEVDFFSYRLGAGEQTRRENWRNLLTRLDSVLSILPLTGDETDVALPESDDPNELAALLGQIEPQVTELAERRETLESQRATLPRAGAALEGLLPLVSENLPEGTFTQAVVVPARERMMLRTLETEVLTITQGTGEVIIGNAEEDLVPALIIATDEHQGAIGDLLSRSVAGQLRLPDEMTDQPLSDALKALRQWLAQIPDELKAVNTQLIEIAHQYRATLLGWRRAVDAFLSEFDVRENFGRTDRTVVMQGWVPTNRVDDLQKAVEESANGEVEVHVLSRHHGDHPPVLLSNPSLARPFEPLISLLSLPSSHDMDPSLLMAIFLPLFFGIMLGDAGYGLILLLLTIYLQMRMGGGGTMGSLLRVLRMGSISSIIFGFLYGEAFGNLGEPFFAWLYNDVLHLFSQHAGHGEHARFWLLLDRTDPEATSTLLLLTIGIGVVHIVLGLLIGVWLALRERDLHHLLERGGMLVGLIGVFVIGGVALGVLPDSLRILAYALLIGGMVMLAIPLGGVGLVLAPIELIGVVVNILSYLRIAAIGLASVYLALVANRLAGALGSLIVGIVVALLFHALNIALGALSPTIHSLRLHYYEFFRKFYVGGGQAYRPFGT